MDTGSSSNTFKYFAFGSNLLRERIMIQNPSAKFVSIGKLENYRFGFETAVTMKFDFWRGATGNIRESTPEDYVMGLVWELSMDDLANLDSQEKHYKAIEVPVILPDGTTINCRTYQINEEVTGACKPDPYYKKVIVSGAKQNGLPEDYIRFLENFEDTGDDTVPLGYKKVLELMKKLHGKEDLDF